jgi:MFS transporter, DHA1 family, multidrug resistance protein
VVSLTIYQLYYFIPRIRKSGFPPPEERLFPALFEVVVLPMAHFMFGWTALASVHWIASLIGEVILVTANFILFQSIFVYLPLSYPKYAASLFASYDLCRSLFATALF